jgi:hypothetical protein
MNSGYRTRYPQGVRIEAAENIDDRQVDIQHRRAGHASSGPAAVEKAGGAPAAVVCMVTRGAGSQA